MKLLACLDELAKLAEVKTELKPHQQRVVEKLRKQPGLVVAHGLGSGKTLTSIAAQDDFGQAATVVVPAALKANYLKEQQKHLTGEPQPSEMMTMQALARDPSKRETPMLIVDEAHRAREEGTATQKALKNISAEKRMLLTASPFYNSPGDIAPLVNLAAGEKVLPGNSDDFNAKYVRERAVSPGILGRLRGIQAGTVRELNPLHAGALRETLGKWVDYHENGQENFPSVTREVVNVPMSKDQTRVYDAVLNNAPSWAAYKIRKGLPPSKQESKDLNAFATAARQVGLSTRAHQPGSPVQAPKIQAAFEHLQKALEANPDHKAVIYSNYLDAGLNPYKERLQTAGIPFGEFTGEMNKAQRDQLVQDYNENRIKALLLSSAGGEGLDLKGTRAIQVLEPHWNNEKLRQVEGRGIRFGSHAHLPEDQRNVNVEYYRSTRPRMGALETLRLRKPGGAIDEYLANRADEKDKLIDSFRALLRKNEQEGVESAHA